MNAPGTGGDELDPAVLVKQWTPKLRGIAFKTGASIDDVTQQAWLLAALAGRPGGVRRGENFEKRWLKAVATHAKKLRAQRFYLSSPATADVTFDDPVFILSALQEIAARVGGSVAEACERPQTPREVAGALGVSVRHGRRIVAQLKAVAAAGQVDMFGGAQL